MYNAKIFAIIFKPIYWFLGKFLDLNSIIKKKKNPKKVVKVTNFYDYNEAIKIPTMVVIDPEGNNLGVLTKFDALNAARELELDLVLVSPSAKPPVARIVDYSKLKYERSKKARKGQSKQIENKEWWFSPTINERDIQIKLAKAKDFLVKGGNAKLTVKWKRKATPEQLKSVMDKILIQITDFAKPVSEVLREGRNLSILVKQK